MFTGLDKTWTSVRLYHSSKGEITMGTTLTGTIARSGISVTGKITPDPKAFLFGTTLVTMDEILDYISVPADLTLDDIFVRDWISGNPNIGDSIVLPDRGTKVTCVR